MEAICMTLKIKDPFCYASDKWVGLSPGCKGWITNGHAHSPQSLATPHSWVTQSTSKIRESSLVWQTFPIVTHFQERKDRNLHWCDISAVNLVYSSYFVGISAVASLGLIKSPHLALLLERNANYKSLNAWTYILGAIIALATDKTVLKVIWVYYHDQVNYAEHTNKM